MNPATERKTRPCGALALQGAIAIAAMAFALTPARGGAALYMPLDGDAGETLAWARAEHAGFLATGPYAGAAFVRVSSPTATLAALRHGAFLFAVPKSLCGSHSSYNSATQQ